MFDTKLELDLPRLARRLIYNTYADTYLVYYIRVYTCVCVHNGITLVPTERSNKLRNLIDFLLKIEITIVQLKCKNSEQVSGVPRIWKNYNRKPDEPI